MVLLFQDLPFDLLFMDELSKAIAPFYPSTSGGGFKQPPDPESDSLLFPIGSTNDYQDRADPSHATYHNQSTHSIVEVPQDEIWAERPLLDEKVRRNELRMKVLFGERPWELPRKPY